MISADPVQPCPGCNGEGITAGPQICRRCNGSRLSTVTNIRPRGEPNAFAPLAKYGAPMPYPAPRPEGLHVRRVLGGPETRFVVELVRGHRSVEMELRRDELQRLRNAADALLGMED